MRSASTGIEMHRHSDTLLSSTVMETDWKRKYNDVEKNSQLYAGYKKLAASEEKVIFGGRIGEYKYYDMDQVIAAVLDQCEKELQ